MLIVIAQPWSTCFKLQWQCVQTRDGEFKPCEQDEGNCDIASKWYPVLVTNHRILPVLVTNHRILPVLVTNHRILPVLVTNHRILPVLATNPS